jgi:hypothetical protein
LLLALLVPCPQALPHTEYGTTGRCHSPVRAGKVRLGCGLPMWTISSRERSWLHGGSERLESAF